MTSTTTSLSSSFNPSQAGQAVTFTAIVSSTNAVPNGTVQFFDGSNLLGSATLSGGAAYLTTSALSAGTHSVKANYIGNRKFAGSASSVLTQSVTAVQTKTATSTALSSSVNPSQVGQTVTFTAKVTAATGSPTGAVQFFDGSTALATGTLASGSTSASISSFAAGSHSIRAVYSGDGAYAGSSSTLAQNVTQTTALSFWNLTGTPAIIEDQDANAVELGVRFTSDVTGTVTGVRFYKGPNNTGAHIGNLWTSTGTKLASVAFTNETASGWQEAKFPTPVAIQANTTYVISYHAPLGRYSATQGSFSTTGLDVAPLHAPAVNNGVYAYGATSSFPNQTWSATNYWVDVVFQPGQPAPVLASSTSLASSPNPSTAGQAVVLDARVSGGAAIPTGTVRFLDGTTVLATGTLASGRASVGIDSLTTGTHSLSAQYSGDGTYSASASPLLTQVVNAPSTTATAVSLNSSLNPSKLGQAVTFTATVTAPAGTPTGSVQFLDGSTVLATAPLASGAASVTAASLAAGTHSITAIYTGDSKYSPSTSPAVTQTVSAYSVALSWQSSPSAEAIGYHIYRGTTTGGPYTRLTTTPVSGLTYTDTAVTAGHAYYYVCTAVDSANTESAYSNETQAIITQ